MLDMVGIVFHMLDKLGESVSEPSDFQDEIKKIDEFRQLTAKDAICIAMLSSNILFTRA